MDLNWTKSEDGWDLSRRHQYLEIVRLMKIQTRTVKKYTKLGYKVMKIPETLYDLILSERQNEPMIIETCEPINVVLNCKKAGMETFLIPYWNKLNVKQAILAEILPILENWSNIKLDGENSVMYGIRRYSRGAILLQHTDRVPTHIISVIFQVGISIFNIKKSLYFYILFLLRLTKK